MKRRHNRAQNAALFTMADVERAYFADDDYSGGPPRQKSLLRRGLETAAVIGGGAAVIGGGVLAFKNRGAIAGAATRAGSAVREAGGKAAQQVGGYFRKTKSGAKTFVKDIRVGSGLGREASVSRNINRAGAQSRAEVESALGGVRREAAPTSVIAGDMRRGSPTMAAMPQEMRRATAPTSAIPQEYRGGGEVPEYLKALRRK